MQAYLVPALARSNLKVLTEAYVCRINTEYVFGSVIAKSVEFKYGGSIHRVFAEREVILSAG